LPALYRNNAAASFKVRNGLGIKSRDMVRLLSSQRNHSPTAKKYVLAHGFGGVRDPASMGWFLAVFSGGRGLEA
jgi:hypothetical protein